MTCKVIVAVCVLLGLGAAAPARAQDGVDPSSKARVRFGPLALNPSVALTNFGRDDNVFYEPDQLEPKSDFTMTLTPATDAWLRMGRTWVNGTIREDLVYYQTYASERAANTSARLGWLVPLNRLTANVNGSYLSARDRPGYEIDARPQRTERAGDGSIEIRALARTFVGVRGATHTIDFDSAATFDGVNLREALNRTANSVAFVARHELTPLTSLIFEASRIQERFDYSPLRDADSTKVVGGIKCDPYALISGSATFGFTRFHPSSAGVPEYRGTTAAADLTYIVLDSTKLTLQGMRDVQFSYELDHPYYVQSGITVSLAQQIYGPLDGVARIGLQNLDYRDLQGAAVADLPRPDIVHSYGGGVGYRLGRDMRVGFNVDRQTRTSAVQLRQYHGLRYGMTVTYGS